MNIVHHELIVVIKYLCNLKCIIKLTVRQEIDNF